MIRKVSFSNSVCVAVVVLACGMSLRADVTVYVNNEAAWSARVSGVTTINWDDVGPLSEGAHQEISADHYSSYFGSPKLGVDVSSRLWVGNPDPSNSNNNAGFFGQDFFAHSGNNVFSPDLTGSPEGILTITFATPMKSMGVWFLDVESDYATTGIEIGGVRYAFPGNQGDNSRSFLGIVSDTAFTEFKIHMASGPAAANGVGIDDVMYSPIPAPGAVLLGLLGFGMVGWFKRRFA